MPLRFLFQILVLFLLSLTTNAAPPMTAVKFIILKPSNSTIGAPVTVTIGAQKTTGEIDTNYQNDVTLITSGSATGGGLVDIINGTGAREINDSTAETVTLSLSDTESTGLDVSSTQEVVFAPLGGGAVWNQIKFWFRDDDGGETDATGFSGQNAGQNANIADVPAGTSFRLRFQIKVTDADGAISPRLEFKEGTGCTAGTWTTISSGSDNFTLRLSPNFIDGVSTTQQLVGGPNFTPGQIFETTNPASLLTISKNQSTEYEWSLKAADNIPLGGTHAFRITDNGAALAGYEQCPTLAVRPPPSRPTGGGVRPTTVIFLGKAFPGATVSIVDKDVHFERQLNQEAVTNEDGSFSTSFVGILQSQHGFGLVIKDKENRATQTKFFNINTLENDFVIKDMLVPPTVGFTNSVVTRGNAISVIGYAAPNHNVSVEIDDKIKKETVAEKDGSYKIIFDSGALDFGSHRVRARQVDPAEKKESGLSTLRLFTVSHLTLPKSDFNGDGNINIKDWSIFLSRWISKDAGQRQAIDLNQDGKIDIADFSIFIRTIRKQ